MDGILSIFVIDTFTCVAFENGAVAMSDMGEVFTSIPSPNLRQLDHDNATYAASMSI